MVRVIRRKNLFQKFTDNLHNFKLFAFLGVIAIGAGITFYLTTQQQDFRQRASGLQEIEYGFNTHLNATGGTGYWENLTLDVFKRSVDDISANNKKWIRLNIAPWESVSGGTETSINWNESAITQYIEAVDYAKSKGLKIYLVTATPDFANSLSDADYTSITRIYHQELANRFKGKVDIWQIFNEADIHNYKGYTALPYSDLTSEYLEKLKTNFIAAKEVIKAADPAVQFASNVSGYPMETVTYDRWDKYFSVIAPHIDLLGLDIYARSETDTTTIKSAVIGVASKFSKPTIIAETGFPSGTADSTESIQANVMKKTIEQLQLAQPKAIIYYQYADTIPTTDKTESSFGVVKSDLTRKSSYEPIMNALALPTGLLRVETNPAVGATITVTSLSTNQVVLTKTWGVDWEKLPTGQYNIEFSNPDNIKIYDSQVVLPPVQTVSIINNQTTTIIADLTKGTTTVSPLEAQSTPTLGQPTPTSTPSPTSTPVPTATPSKAPTPTPQTTGFLRVETSPATAATIRILKTNGSVVMSSTWSIDWKPLAAGIYYIQFSYPRTAGLITPKTTLFRQYSTKVTEIIGNFNTGRVSVVYK